MTRGASGGEGALSCPACGASLPAAFPGGSVTCACGHRVELGGGGGGGGGAGDVGARSTGLGYGGAAGAGAMADSGPYRSMAAAPPLASAAPCPFCGNECPPLVRICPHCDVRLDNVRCQRCYSLQPPGTFACGRCGAALELEPLLDATDAPCPRCRHPLEVGPGDDTRIHECPRCGGMFVARDALAEILCRAEVGGALRGRSEAPAPAPAGRGEASARALGEVRYVACPLCHSSMNRVNFGKVSGVIVDVCKMHGTWFDAGELTRVVAFAASGGLDRTRERERAEKKVEKKQSADLHAAFVAMETRQGEGDRLELWNDLLRILMRW